MNVIKYGYFCKVNKREQENDFQYYFLENLISKINFNMYR